MREEESYFTNELNSVYVEHTCCYYVQGNKTDIHFTKEEIGLLNKGRKYNLSHKHKHWINNLVLEADNAVTLLPPGEQEYGRHQIAKNIKNSKIIRTHREVKLSGGK